MSKHFNLQRTDGPSFFPSDSVLKKLKNLLKDCSALRKYHVWISSFSEGQRVFKEALISELSKMRQHVLVTSRVKIWNVSEPLSLWKLFYGRRVAVSEKTNQFRSSRLLYYVRQSWCIAPLSNSVLVLSENTDLHPGAEVFACDRSSIQLYACICTIVFIAEKHPHALNSMSTQTTWKHETFKLLLKFQTLRLRQWSAHFQYASMSIIAM